MEIHCLDPLGINGYERKANEVLSQALPNSWKGYSSLEMVGRQSGDFEADIILITHDRIIVVELKNYAGKIFSDGKKWIQEKPNGVQENRINALSQASRAAKILKSKLQAKLRGKYVPYVDKCVVLCGSADAKNLPSDEQDYVFTLERFKKIGDKKEYAKLFGREFSCPRAEDAPNKNITVWDKVFSNNSADFKAKTFSINNYVMQGTALFQHTEGLYSEFQSQRADNRNYKAIMRRWDFTAPCIVESARTPDQRALIAHRESSVLGYIDNQEDDLKNIHLQLLHLPTDLTADFVELYEWPNKKERLDVFLRKNQARLTTQSRIDLIQSLISQLARLHDIDVAHRDLGTHSIWMALPSKVVLSNFLTATYPDPDNKTVANVRKILQHGRVETPEELFEDTSGTAFTRDVYLAIAACHYVAFDRWPAKQEGIYTWEPVSDNEIDEKLGSWFEKGLELDSKERFQDLRDALTELNKLLKTSDDAGVEKLNLISKFHTQKNVYADFGAIPVDVKGTYHFLKSTDDSFGIKAWFGVTDTNQNGGINHQLLSFFSRLELLNSSGLNCVPKIYEYGLNPQLTSAYFKFEWIQGKTWQESVEEISAESAIGVIRSLLKSVLALHSSGLFHGDIQPKNIVIRNDSIIFIDIAEYEEDKYTPLFVPHNFESLPKSSVDKFATIKLINELAIRFHLIHLSQHTGKLLDIPEIATSELERLHDNLESIVNPPAPKSIQTYVVSHKTFPELEEEFVADDGTYYLSLKTNAGREKDLLSVKVSGVQKQLELLINPDRKFVVGAYLKPIRHDQFIWNKRDAELDLEGEIKLSNVMHDASVDFFDFILDSPVYKELLAADKKKQNTLSLTRPTLSLHKLAESEVTDAKDIWRVLVETEHESNPKIQIVTEPKFTETGLVILRYAIEENGLDFDLSSERVTLKTEVRGELRDIGVIEDFGSDTIVMKPRGRVTPQIGDTVTLEGSLTAASLAKREKAVTNLIKGRGIISNLTDYFSPGIKVEPAEGIEPTDEELDAYTEYDEGNNNKVIFQLNSQQRAAFKDLYKYSPVSLLQGPPGTGKTAFIGSFIHYSISKGARRVLLVSQSHEAVNNATEKVRTLFSKTESTIDIVRLGNQNNLSMALDDVGEKALQEHYRDKFRAEYKERICNIVNELGIDEKFVSSIAEFELFFGQKIDQLISLQKDKELLGNGDLHNRASNLLEKLSRFLVREANLDLSFDDIELPDLRDHLYSALASKFDIYSPDLLFKLKNIVAISNEWLSVMASSQAQFQNFLAKTRTLVCGTCVGVGRYHYGIQENIYDLVVIDEAARSPASELAIAMQVGRKVLLVGDHKQLPPLFDEQHIKAAKRLLPGISSDELKRSDFERAFVSDYGKKIGCSLRTQYRMAPAIGDLVSECFYAEDGGLETGRTETTGSYQSLIKEVGTTVTWVDTSNGGKQALESRPRGKGVNVNSFVNNYEVETIVKLISRLYENQFSEKILVEDEEPKIGVICMYGEQVRQLVKKINSLSWARTLLEKRILKIDTVDSYQGKENDIVILSLVRNNQFGNEGYVSSENRANVSLSRAKEALFIVGSKEMWSTKNQGSAFGKVFKYISNQSSDNYSVVDAVAMEKS